MLTIALLSVSIPLLLLGYLRRKQVKLSTGAVWAFRVWLFVGVGLMLYVMLRPGYIR